MDTVIPLHVYVPRSESALLDPIRTTPVDIARSLPIPAEAREEYASSYVCLILHKWKMYNKFSATKLATSKDSLLSGTDWIYFYVEQILAYDFKLLYFWFFLNSIVFPENLIYKILFFYINGASAPILYWSALLNGFFNLKLFAFNGLEKWLLNFTAYSGMGQVKDFVLFSNSMSALKTYWVNSSLELNIHIDALLTSEGVFNTTFMFINALFIFFFVILGVSFYFTFITSSTKEESTIDNDFMMHSITIEAEEEISSIDDILLTIIFVMYIFGWFFYIHCWVILTTIPELTILYYLFPLMYYVILNIPTFLVYDFGIFFLAYLKGSSQLPLLLLELVYDYIALAAFYIRILVQGVRLILMIFTFYSLQEMIIDMKANQRWFLGYESIIDDYSRLSVSQRPFNFFFITFFLTKVTHWMYELLHTFFVLTAQFAAFFAMIFWLFFFLYTSFVLEKQEAYFELKRKQRKTTVNFLLNLKK